MKTQILEIIELIAENYVNKKLTNEELDSIIDTIHLLKSDVFNGVIWTHIPNDQAQRMLNLFRENVWNNKHSNKLHGLNKTFIFDVKAYTNYLENAGDVKIVFGEINSSLELAVTTKNCESKVINNGNNFSVSKDFQIGFKDNLNQVLTKNLKDNLKDIGADLSKVITDTLSLEIPASDIAEFGKLKDKNAKIILQPAINTTDFRFTLIMYFIDGTGNIISTMKNSVYYDTFTPHP